MIDRLIEAIKRAPLTGDGIDPFAARSLVHEIQHWRDVAATRMSDLTAALDARDAVAEERDSLLQKVALLTEATSEARCVLDGLEAGIATVPNSFTHARLKRAIASLDVFGTAKT